MLNWMSMGKISFKRLDSDVEHIKQTEWQALKIRMRKEANNTSLRDFYRRLFTNPNQEKPLRSSVLYSSMYPSVFFHF